MRRDLGLVLPVISLTTLLVISVVKSSLALSLGLVGALSIVRFRTPIKEPEELAYIFLAIAVGLALGADQREVASIALPVILIIISIIDRLRPIASPGNGQVLINIEVDVKKEENNSALNMFKQIFPDANVRRIDQDVNTFSIVALVKFTDSNALNKFSHEFHDRFPKGRFSIVDDSFVSND